MKIQNTGKRLIILLLPFVLLTAIHAERIFSQRHYFNIIGDMTMIGNSVMLGPNNTCPRTNVNNSNIKMIFADIDSNSKTFNSTSADISLPSYLKKEDIVHAGLYWQGRFIKQNIPNNANQILLKLPNETNYVKKTANDDYQTILNSAPGFGPYNDYQGIADITTRFKKYIQSGTNNRTIMVANLQSSTQENSFGAWMIVVVYKDKNSRMKNISIYDGFKSLTDTTPITNTLSGFKTPKNGDVFSKFFVFGGEGDILWNLDSISLTKKDGTSVSLGKNIFNSSIAINGKNVTNRNPNCQNTIGIDIDSFDVGDPNGTKKIIGNDQSQTTITLTAPRQNKPNIYDQVFPGMFAFSTDLFTPKLCYDYDVRIGDHIKVPSDNRTIETNAWDDDLTLTLLIRSEISDFPIENSKLNVTFSPNTLHYVANGSKVSTPDTNVYTPINDIDSSKGQIGIGRGSQALLESTGGIIGAYETVFAKQRFDFGSLSHYKGSFDITVSGTIQFDPSADPVPYTLSTAAPKDSQSYIGPCGKNPVYDPVWANFNVERNDTKDYTDPKIKYPLYTQIAGKPFSVSIVSYTKNSNGEYTVPLDTNASVEIEIIDASIFDNNSSTGYDSTCSEPAAQGQGAFINFQNHNRIDVNIPDDIPNFNNDIALQSAAFRLWVISVKETNGTKRIIPHSCTLDGNTSGCFKNLYKEKIKPYDSNATLGIHCQTACSGSNSDQTCYSCLRNYFATPICSRDNFSIRPESFRVQFTDSNETNGTTGTPLTENDQTSGKLNANLSLAAGYNYRADINATLFNDAGRAKAYHNEHFKADSNLTTFGSKTDNNIIAALEFNDNAVCNDQTHRSYKMRFQNGSVDKDTYIFHHNTGNYRFWMLDSNWTNVDRANYPNKTRFGDCVINDTRNECTDCDTSNPSNSARNGDGKLGCVINSNVNKDNKYVELPLRFEPYQFDLSDINLTQNPYDNPYLFMNDFTKDNTIDPSMSMSFEGYIIAEGKNNGALSNFTNGCSASDVRVTLDLNSTNGSIPVHIFYDGAVQTGIDKNITVPKNKFGDDDNGSAYVRIYTTVKKPYRLHTGDTPANPVKIGYEGINAFGDSAVSKAALGDHTPKGEQDVNKSIIYVYGKVVPEKLLYDNIVEDYKMTKLYIDVYCDETSLLDTCANLYGINAAAKGELTDSSKWRYAAPLFTTDTGSRTKLTVSIFSERDSNPSVSAPTIAKAKSIIGVPFTRTGTAMQKDINVSTGNKYRPSTVKVHYEPSPWLIDNNESQFYRDRFIGPAAWSGVGKTGDVVETRSNLEKNRRMNW